MTKAKEEQRISAEELYLLGWDQKRIAHALDISEKTISTWARKYGWAKIKADKLLSETNRTEKIEALLNRQVDTLTKLMEEKPDAILEPKHADGIFKLHAMLKSKSVSFSQTVDLMKDFMDFIATKSPELAKQLMPFADEFILAKKPIA